MIPQVANSILACSLGWLQEEDRQWLIASDSNQSYNYPFLQFNGYYFHSCVLEIL
jgi:hypothetical protein